MSFSLAKIRPPRATAIGLIARAFDLGPHTVKRHVAGILGKTAPVGAARRRPVPAAAALSGIACA